MDRRTFIAKAMGVAMIGGSLWALSNDADRSFLPRSRSKSYSRPAPIVRREPERITINNGTPELLNLIEVGKIVIGTRVGFSLGPEWGVKENFLYGGIDNDGKPYFERSQESEEKLTIDSLTHPEKYGFTAEFYEK